MEFRRALLFCCTLLALLPGIGTAQTGAIAGYVPGSNVMPSPTTSFVPWLNSCNPACWGVGIRPSLKFGYERLGVNFNLPVPFSGAFGIVLSTGSSLDVQLRDTGVWVGEAGVDADIGNLGLYVSLEGSFRRDVRVLTPSEPFRVGSEQVWWRGSKFRAWRLDAGAAYRLKNGLSLVGGLKNLNLTLVLSDPTGTIQLLNPLGNTLSGDIRATLLIPYAGMRFGRFGATATLVGSPLAIAHVRIPFRDLYPHVFGPGWDSIEEAKYKFDRVGGFLEARLEYGARPRPDLNLTAWFKGTWLQVKGKGVEQYQQRSTFGYSVDESGAAAGCLTINALAGGIAAEVAF